MNFDGSIEVYQDVSFVYPREKAPTLRHQLELDAIYPWRMDPDRENEIKRKLNGSVEVITFLRESFCGISQCSVSLWCNSPEEWSIPSVAPKNFGDRLSIHQYNDVLEEFVRLILDPSLSSLPADKVALVITPRRLNLHDMMSSNSLRKLRAFLSLGLHGALALHPNDEDRLCDFILALHKDGHLTKGAKRPFDSDLFRRWLKEAESWSEEDASGFAVRVDHGLALLNRSQVQDASQKSP